MIVVFDTETTGLFTNPEIAVEQRSRVIEFAAAILDRRGETIEEVSFLINPEEPLTEEIVKITGITDADLAGKPTFVHYFPEIRRVFEARAAVFAHNLPFDRQMIRNEIERIGADRAERFPWPINEFCTVGLFRPQWGRNPKLRELYEWSIGRELDQTHRALDDVRALVEVIRKHVDVER